MATNTKTSTDTSVEKTESPEVTGVQKTIQDNAPSFVSKYINIVFNNLESFRVNSFNSQYIFYPVLIIFVFFIIRAIWRKFY